jgi:DNA polymerase elongation subunit (family B)
MTGEDIQQQDLVISKLLKLDIVKYKSLFPHVSAAIQLSNGIGKYPVKGDTIRYVYTNSQHNNPLCRVVPKDVRNAQAASLSQYDKEKYRHDT